MKKTEAIHIHRNLVAWAKQVDMSDLDIEINIPRYTSEVNTRSNELQAKKEDHIEADLILAQELADCFDPAGAENEATEEEQTSERERLIQ